MKARSIGSDKGVRCHDRYSLARLQSNKDALASNVVDAVCPQSYIETSDPKFPSANGLREESLSCDADVLRIKFGSEGATQDKL